ncbi:MAG: hypothetical protein ACREQY_23430 [Candidatus Binatia bacterium]
MKRIAMLSALALFVGGAPMAHSAEGCAYDEGQRVPVVSVYTGRGFTVVGVEDLDASRQRDVGAAFKMTQDPSAKDAECTSLTGPTWWSVNCTSGNCHCYIYGDIDGTAPPSTDCGCS